MKTERKSKTIWESVGVFLAFVMLGAMTFSFFSPIVPTNAADTLTEPVSAVIKPTISITQADDFAFGTVTPTDAGQFASVSGKVKVQTNDTTGYKLYISLNDSTKPNMTATGISTYIAPCGSNVTSSTMVKDTWGYSTNGTNFYPVTSSNVQIGEKASPLTQLTPYEHTIYMGGKFSSTLQSGTYSNTVKFTATTNGS